MTPSEPDDEALLAAHLQGDPEAFNRLVSRHERRVYGLCLRILGNREDAEDATQEAFLAVLRRAASFRHAAAFSTWLYRVAVNAATDQARRRGRARTVPLTLEDAGLPPQPGSDLAEAATDAVAVQAALVALPLEFRVAVVLCDLLRLPYAEAASLLGVPVGTVKSRVFRGRLALAEQLAEVGGGEGEAEPALGTSGTPRPSEAEARQQPTKE